MAGKKWARTVSQTGSQVVSVISLLLMLTGCFNDSKIDLVGQWQIINPTHPLISGKFQFSQDGKFLSEEQQRRQGNVIAHRMGGSYRLNGDQLSLHVKHSDKKNQPKNFIIRVAMTEGGKTMSLVFSEGAVAYRRISPK